MFPLQYRPRLAAIVGVVHEIIKAQISRLIDDVAGDVDLRRQLVLYLTVHRSESLIQLNH